ncbi:MAG: DUF2283 domain-containing protein [Anaerolineae bacterium]|nr:DUF2283 domain-containing protein [Gemmatimonadaceae bacterium]
MKWTYDPSVDALMITLLPGKRSKRAEELRPGLICDYDDAGHPISIELLEASSHLPLKNLESLPLPGVMLTLSEASRLAGLDAATLRQQIHNKRLRATKRRREWWVEPSALQEYLDSRAPQGRRNGRKNSARRPVTIELVQTPSPSRQYSRASSAPGLRTPDRAGQASRKSPKDSARAKARR